MLEGAKRLVTLTIPLTGKNMGYFWTNWPQRLYTSSSHLFWPIRSQIQTETLKTIKGDSKKLHRQTHKHDLQRYWSFIASSRLVIDDDLYQIWQACYTQWYFVMLEWLYEEFVIGGFSSANVANRSGVVMNRHTIALECLSNTEPKHDIW